jgi:hypothetical protein
MMPRSWLFAYLLLFAPAHADQFQAFDGVEVHYVVLNTLFLQEDIAARYGVERGRDHAIVNLSVLDRDGAALAAEVTGSTINLLNQSSPLLFTTKRDGESIYSIASFHYTDRDVLRFALTVNVPGRVPMNVVFQQEMFVENEP